MMNIDHLKDINIYDYELPDEVTDGWSDMFEFIEEYNEARLNKIKSYLDIFIMDMQCRGFTRKQVEDEIKAFYSEKALRNKSK